MDNNKLSTNLEKINTSVTDIRTALNAQNVSIEDLSDMVTEVKTSLDELETNMVYQVTTRDEMYSLSNVVEGSTCLVKGHEIRDSRAEDAFTIVYLPDEVRMPIHNDETSIVVNIAGTGHGSLSGTLSGMYFDFPMIIKGQGAYGKNIQYIASIEGDNYVYRRQDTYGTPVTSAGELTYQTYDNKVGQFFRIDAEVLETYIYQEGTWVYINPSAESTDGVDVEEVNMLLDSILGGIM